MFSSLLVRMCFFIGIMVLLISCQSTKDTTIAAKPELPLIETPVNIVAKHCESPRPEICTKEYRPVCATKDTGIRCVTTPCPSIEEVTKSNACTACADEKVTSYVPGACS